MRSDRVSQQSMYRVLVVSLTGLFLSAAPSAHADLVRAGCGGACNSDGMVTIPTPIPAPTITIPTPVPTITIPTPVPVMTVTFPTPLALPTGPLDPPAPVPMMSVGTGLPGLALAGASVLALCQRRRAARLAEHPGP
jgi:hypothetical protein